MSQSTAKRARSRVKCSTYLAISLIAGVSMAGSPSFAQSSPPSARALGTAASTNAYWTEDRMRNAVPLDLPVARGALGSASQGSKPTGQSRSHAGVRPIVDLSADQNRQLFTPSKSASLSAPEPTDFGTSGYYFTTSRVFPPVASRVYPNRAAGKLFFSDSVHGGNFVCSASVIGRRLVVTAGHCIAHGSTNSATRHFYSNIIFVPAYLNGAAPAKQWAWTRGVTTNNWYLSGGVPNLQDVGIIAVADQNVGGVSRRVADVTGSYGWWTLWGRQYPNQITQLGYPCNLDSCQLMQVNHAQGVRIVSNNVELGSLMQGGSSGGPWVQDYGVSPTGGSGFTAGNWILGVTSYQYTGSPSPSVLGASIFQNAGYGGHGFGDLWNVACSWQTGNC